jgi:hypothetical protein
MLSDLIIGSPENAASSGAGYPTSIEYLRRSNLTDNRNLPSSPRLRTPDQQTEFNTPSSAIVSVIRPAAASRNSDKDL